MKNRVKLEKKVMEFANSLNEKGYDLKDVMMALFHRASTIHALEAGPRRIIVELTGEPAGIAIEVPEEGYKVAIVPAAQATALHRTMLVGDEDVTAEFPPMSLTRIEEFLDYASCYGDYDENTPNGTPSQHEGEGGHGMNDYRRQAIVIFKRMLGFLPPSPNDCPFVFPDHEYRAKQLEGVVREARDLLHGYAQHHLAKMPPDLDKAARNVRMAEKLSVSLGEDYDAPPIPTETPQEAARNAQEADLLPGTGERPRKLSTAPLDRQELLTWIDMKLDGCAKNGMREASDVLQAFRGEIAQHLESVPIDFATALAAFYKEVYERNVRAGWWSDISTNTPKKRNVGELFILFVTELWEAYDAYVNGNAPDDKLPQYPGLGVELGDLQIRLADFCGALAAGNIIMDSDTRNPGDLMWREIGVIAQRYESIRKTEAAKGDVELAAVFLPAADVGEMIVAKLDYNAHRPDHKIENRLKDDGKRT